MIILINDNMGNFSEQTASYLTNSSGFKHLREMVKADVNGNGSSDIIVAAHGYDTGNLDGEFNGVLSINNAMLDGTVVDQTPFNYIGFSHSLDAADIDNDGDIDIVISDITGIDVANDQSIRLLRNDGAGQFSTEYIPLTIEDGSLPFITASKFVDLNQDGFVDLVLGGDQRKHDLAIIWNDGKGNFF